MRDVSTQPVQVDADDVIRRLGQRIAATEVDLAVAMSRATGAEAREAGLTEQVEALRRELAGSPGQ